MSLSISKTQAKNVVTIEGIVSEIKLREGTAGATKKEYIGGEIVVELEQEVSGVRTSVLVPVSVFANKLKNDGNPNPAFKGLKEIEATYNSIAVVGRDKADKVRIDKGEITENVFYGQNSELVTFPRIRNTFFKKVTGDYNPHADFIAKIVIANIKDEIDKEGIETGRLVIKGLIVQYGGKIDVVDFVVEKKEAVAFIRDNYKKNDTVQVSGKVRFTSITETKETPQGFGDPIIETVTRNKRELVITSGSDGAMDEDESYDLSEIAKGLTARTEKLAADAEKTKTSASTSSSSANLGF